MSQTQFLRTQLVTAAAGDFDMPGAASHLVVIHASGRIAQSVACEGPLRRRELRRGDIDLIPAGAPLRLVDDGPSQVLTVALSPQWVSEGVDDLGLRPARLRPQFSMSDERLSEVAWRLHRRTQAGRQDLYDDHLAGELLRQLYRTQQPALDGAEGRTRPLHGSGLRRVLDYIESHLDEPIGIQDLALEAGLGPTAFKAAFRATFGAPAHRYVVIRRAERARLLLLEGAMPASQVALEAGFSHQTHMARWMRRLFGQLPSDFANASDG